MQVDLFENIVFTFGSNEAGIHGKGAAKRAVSKYGAKYGKGVGLVGNSYGIPTKDKKLKVLGLSKIKSYIEQFLLFAEKYSSLTFYVTRIGCGLAGFEDSQIAPLFKNASKNCIFDIRWKPYLKSDFGYFDKEI